MDPNFARTVVLLVQHDENGALGIVLNRPLETTVRQVLEQALGEDIEVEGALHHGGPCEGPLMVVHTDSAASQIDVGGGVYFTADREDVERIIRGDDEIRTRYFVGYAGWSAEQLEGELSEGSWLTRTASPSDIFESGPKLWSKLTLIETLKLPVQPKDLPDDPSVN